MTRPIKPRDVASYKLEIQRITRLRSALVCDSRLDRLRVAHAVKNIDALIRDLVGFAEGNIIIPTGMSMNQHSKKVSQG